MDHRCLEGFLEGLRAELQGMRRDLAHADALVRKTRRALSRSDAVLAAAHEQLRRGRKAVFHLFHRGVEPPALRSPLLLPK